MKRLLSLSIILCLLAGTASYAGVQYEDVVYLKNGFIIRGVIIEQVPGEQIRIKSRDGNVFVFSMEEVERFGKEEVPLKGPEKRPDVAWLLSFVISGGGQFYNGDIGKGVVALTLSIAGFALFYVYYPQEAWGPPATRNKELAYGGLAVAAGVWIWSMIDAPRTAQRLNAERGYTSIDVPLSDQLTLRFAPIERRDGVTQTTIRLGLR
jgi:TM2 domain-containing membrane protein YozV